MTSSQRAAVAVSGVSVLSPLGDTSVGVGEALRKGAVALAPHADWPELQVARLTDFDASRYAKVRGMRVYPRATQLEICAAVLALADAGFPEGSIDPLKLGVVTASSYSHLETLIEYDRGLTSLGMQRTNPTLMPLGLPSAPGAATALALNAKAFAITLNDGGASGLAALGLGARMVAEGRADICVVAGAATLCREFIQSAHKAELVAGSEPLRVFDERSRGTAFGEAAAALVLERASDVHARGRRPMGVVCGQASSFASDASVLAAALVRASRTSLRLAAIAPESIALVSAGASGVPSADRAHARALLELFGAASAPAGGPCITAPKGNFGETLDVSALLQCISVLRAQSERVAPPIAQLQHPCVPGLNYATTERELPAGAALVTASSLSGACSALVLGTEAA